MVVKLNEIKHIIFFFIYKPLFFYIFFLISLKLTVTYICNYNIDHNFHTIVYILFDTWMEDFKTKNTSTFNKLKKIVHFDYINFVQKTLEYDWSFIFFSLNWHGACFFNNNTKWNASFFRNIMKILDNGIKILI